MNIYVGNKSDNLKDIVEKLLDEAGITIDGDQSYDIQVHNDDFYKRVIQQGSLGLGESYMDSWWDCERLDILFYKILRAKLDKKVPHNVEDILRIAVARFRNLQTKKRVCFCISYMMTIHVALERY